MSARELSKVLLAIAGIWFVIDAITGLPMLVGILLAMPFSDGSIGARPYWFGIGSAVLKAALGAYLLVRRSTIASRLCPDARDGPVETTSQWQATAFAVLGIYFFTRGLSGATGPIAAYELGPNLVSELVGPLTQIAVGIALFFGANALSRFWHRARRAGLESRAA